MRLLFCACSLVVHPAYSQTSDSTDGSLKALSQTNGDEVNPVVSIDYPARTKREGAGLNIPLPPAAHPRLFLTKKDIPVLQEKSASPLLKETWNRLVESAALSTNGKLRLDSARQNFDPRIRNAIEAKALMYVLTATQETGRQAVAALLNFYSTLKIDMAKPDVCRDIGRAIVTGSLVYDWCYPLLSKEEKEILIARMETLAAQLEIKWPALVQGSVVGHGVEAQLSRDMLSCGVATYNEKPEIYNLAAGRIVAEFVPVRKFFYPAAYHHQGSAYGPYRFAWDMYATFIFDKMGYPAIFGKEQAKAPYYFIYSRRPDGQLLRNGDDFNELFTPFGRYWPIGGSENGIAGSYFKDPVLYNEAVKEGQVGKGPDYLFDFLMLDSHAPPGKDKSQLPLTSYFAAPFGAMIARTGWEEGLASPAAVAEMKIGVYNFVNHQHLDAGSFQVYYKGPLAVQSGIYQGKTGGYGSDHFKNYSQRTIAHNTMLFYDPAEKFTYQRETVANDGGQPYPAKGAEPRNLEELLQNGYKTGSVQAHAFGPDSIKPAFSYLKGELAEAYGAKVKTFTRQFVFLNLENQLAPAVLVVFDNVTTANKNFRKYWLLHSVEEPLVEGNRTTIRRSEKGYQGKLVNTTLLPAAENVTIEKIGGSGNEFNVFGKNFPQAPANQQNAADGAAWRIQVAAKTPSASDVFLNVLQVADGALLQPLPVPQRVETAELTGLQVAGRMILFSKSGKLIREPVHLTCTADSKVLITDLQAGRWVVQHGIQTISSSSVDKDGQCLYFTAVAGVYVIRRNQ